MSFVKLTSASIHNFRIDDVIKDDFDEFESREVLRAKAQSVVDAGAGEEIRASEDTVLYETKRIEIKPIRPMTNVKWLYAIAESLKEYAHRVENEEYRVRLGTLGVELHAVASGIENDSLDMYP